MFLEGFASPAVNMVGYVYLCEFMTKKWQDYVATIYCLLYAAVYLVLTFYFQIISNRYQWIMLFGTCLLICGLIVGLVLVESPAWLLNIGKIEEGKTAIRKICKMNGAEGLCEEEIEELGQNPEAIADASVMDNVPLLNVSPEQSPATSQHNSPSQERRTKSVISPSQTESGSPKTSC